jgi:prepilin peptidase CpaA
MIAGISDIRRRRIPNWLTVSGAVAGVVFHGWRSGFAGVRVSVLGFGLALAVYLLLFSLHAMSAGDAKLMAAVGAVAGAPAWWRIFLLTAVLGGFLALLVLLRGGRLRRAFWNAAFILREISHLRPPYLAREELDVRSARSLKLPHGAVIALGAWCYAAIDHFGFFTF